VEGGVLWRADVMERPCAVARRIDTKMPMYMPIGHRRVCQVDLLHSSPALVKRSSLRREAEVITVKDFHNRTKHKAVGFGQRPRPSPATQPLYSCPNRRLCPLVKGC
jgi:hypothetical protein